MIPLPHHQQYYWKAEMQRYRCQRKMLTILEIVDRLIKGNVYFASQHHFYKKFLNFV